MEPKTTASPEDFVEERNAHLQPSHTMYSPKPETLSDRILGQFMLPLMVVASVVEPIIAWFDKTFPDD